MHIYIYIHGKYLPQPRLQIIYGAAPIGILNDRVASQNEMS